MFYFFYFLKEVKLFHDITQHILHPEYMCLSLPCPPLHYKFENLQHAHLDIKNTKNTQNQVYLKTANSIT